MKKIAITQRLILNDSYYELREALDVKWAELLQKCDILSLPLSLNIDYEKYFSEFVIDGLILSGGNDLSKFSNEITSNYRDKFEINLISYSIKNNIPVLGICRGMQIIGDYFNAEFAKVHLHAGTRHGIHVVNNSNYCKIINKYNNVNSYHNFSIKSIPGTLKIIAQSDDGSIEAIEHIEHKILAHMWHPERESPFNEDDILLIKQFFNV